MKLWNRRLVWSGLLVLAALTLAGCASPDKRIAKEPELFASYPPETQALIREGKVGIGFDEHMVWLAVGEPDRKWVRTDATGTHDIWAFTRFEQADGLPLYRGGYHRAYDGAYPFYDHYPARKSRDYFRVTFKEGRVVAVEVDEGGAD